MKYIERTPEEIREFNSQKEARMLSLNKEKMQFDSALVNEGSNPSSSDTFLTKNETDELILELFYQSCGNENLNQIDNQCMSAYEDACEYLERKGYLKNINGRMYPILKQENKSKKQDDYSISAEDKCKCGHERIEHNNYVGCDVCGCNKFSFQDKSEVKDNSIKQLLDKDYSQKGSEMK